MKTHQPIIMIALSWLLMLTVACENKAVRSVSGIEDMSSGGGPHEVAGYQDEEDFFGEPVVQDEEDFFGKPVVQFEDESLVEDDKAVAALPSGDFSANQEGSGLTGEADKTGSESSSGLSALMGNGIREPSSSGSEMPNGKSRLQASASDRSQAPARDQLAASGPSSSGTSAAHDDSQKREAPVLQDLKDIFFAYDSWQLSRQSHRILEANAKWLKAHPHARITIEGHCDQRGTQAYNYILGQKRAETTQWYLSQLGVPSHQMAVVSFGKDQPLCYVFSAACFQSNRRAHFSMEVNTVSLN